MDMMFGKVRDERRLVVVAMSDPEAGGKNHDMDGLELHIPRPHASCIAARPPDMKHVNHRGLVDRNRGVATGPEGKAKHTMRRSFSLCTKSTAAQCADPRPAL